MTSEFLDYYSKNINRDSKPIVGLVKFLNWAKSNNISMAVCTNKQEKLAVDLLKKLDLIKFLNMLLDPILLNLTNPIQDTLLMWLKSLVVI